MELLSLSLSLSLSLDELLSLGGLLLGGEGGAELGGDGGAELGGVGICGGCGGLLGQALRNRLAQTSPAILSNVRCDMPLILLKDFIGSDNLLRNNRLSICEAGPECRFAQFPHQPVSLDFISLTLIQTNQLDNMSARIDLEF